MKLYCFGRELFHTSSHYIFQVRIAEDMDRGGTVEISPPPMALEDPDLIASRGAQATVGGGTRALDSVAHLDTVDRSQDVPRETDEELHDRAGELISSCYFSDINPEEILKDLIDAPRTRETAQEIVRRLETALREEAEAGLTVLSRSQKVIDEQHFGGFMQNRRVNTLNINNPEDADLIAGTFVKELLAEHYAVLNPQNASWKDVLQTLSSRPSDLGESALFEMRLRNTLREAETLGIDWRFSDPMAGPREEREEVYYTIDSMVRAQFSAGISALAYSDFARTDIMVGERSTADLGDLVLDPEVRGNMAEHLGLPRTALWTEIKRRSPDVLGRVAETTAESYIYNLTDQSDIRVEGVRSELIERQNPQFNEAIDFIVGHPNDFWENSRLNAGDVAYLFRCDVDFTRQDGERSENESVAIALDGNMNIIGVAD